MNVAKQMTVLIIAGTATILVAAGPTSGPATRPTTAPASRPAPKVKEPDPLRLAINALTQEAQAALAQRKPLPRQKSDYFPADNKIDVQALIKALGSRISQNPRIDAYVKFQLLAAREAFDGDLALPALKAYVLGAPPMIALPGTTQQEQQKWNQKAMTARQDDVEKINDEWKAALAPYIEVNDIIIAYRDLMKSKIQPPDDLKHKYFEAYLEDLSQRGTAGFEIDKPLAAISKTISSWAPLAKKAQVQDMLTALKEYTARKPPKMFEELSWKDGKARWSTHDAGLSVTKIEKLRDQLVEAEKNAIE